jgi:hypothetical protein
MLFQSLNFQSHESKFQLNEKRLGVWLTAGIQKPRVLGMAWSVFGLAASPCGGHVAFNG